MCVAALDLCHRQQSTVAETADPGLQLTEVNRFFSISDHGHFREQRCLQTKSLRMISCNFVSNQEKNAPTQMCQSMFLTVLVDPEDAAGLSS